MKRATLAVAIALGVMGMGLGVSVAPNVAADHNDCLSNDYTIEDSPPLLPRSLDPGELKVGLATLDADTDMTLEIEMTDAGQNGELSFEVFHVENGSCVQYTRQGCDETIPKSDEDIPYECNLDALPSQTKNYWVHNLESGNQNSIEFEDWLTVR